MESRQGVRKIKIGLLGSGTVGTAVQDFILEQKGTAKAAADLELEIVKIYTRHPRKKKWFSARPELFTTDPREVIAHPEADLIVEVLGAESEKDLSLYKEYIVESLRRGKSVVTSDKAVLAKFGKEIWNASAQYRSELRFEACVGGGIPIIRSLTESFSAEEPAGIFGIVNGTCNYILGEMQNAGKTYEQALQEAQHLGYAESNPQADTTGVDAEAKLILLAAVAFGSYVEPGTILRKGIEEIQPIDFLYADKKGGCTIKHIAAARRVGGSIEAMVAPVLVPHGHFISKVDGVTNAIFFKGKRSAGRDESLTESEHGGPWNYAFLGPGAGAGPTAVAVLGDVCDLARGRLQALPSPYREKPSRLTFQPEHKINASFYLRFVVRDRPGIVGDICQTLGKKGINISEIWQLPHSKNELAVLARRYRLDGNLTDILPFVITLEKTSIGQVEKALEMIRRKDFNRVKPVWLSLWRE